MLHFPVLARLFEQVPVLFWPVLWFNIIRLARWHTENGRPEVLLSVTWWGGLIVDFASDPAAPPTFYRPLSDYIDQPAYLAADVLARLAARPRVPALPDLCAAIVSGAANLPAAAFDTT
ncbi:MAG: hypothetical protein ACK46Q_08890 [Hyphomonas sp.]